VAPEKKQGENKMNQVRIIATTIVVAALTGCASVSSTVNNRFDLSSVNAAVTDTIEPIAIADKRSADGKGLGKPTAIIPAASFTPALADVLARRLATERIPELQGKNIALIEGFTFVEAVPSSNQGMPYRPVMVIGAPVLANVIGNLVGAGIVSLMKPGDRLKLMTSIEITVDGKSYRAAGYALNDAGTIESNVTASVSKAINRLIAEIREGSNVADNVAGEWRRTATGLLVAEETPQAEGDKKAE
jgi:hypothetical protein